jgi:two-component system response regulator AtoC
MLRILLVDDEPSIRLSLGDALRAAGHDVTIAADGAAGLEHATARPFDVIITDVRMPKLDGLSLFRRIKQDSPGTDVLIMTAYGAVSDAVQALKEGASDYLIKPFDTEELLIRLHRSEDKRNLRRDLDRAREELSRTTGDIVGTTPIMRRLLDRTDTIAASEAPVLITGESGTGKELVARRIHALSSRRDKPFVAVNCAAFPETLLEAELFGHEKGAFTNAIRRRDGRFKTADTGTLFLDEIAEIPPTAQVKLLRVLQEGVVEPIGSDSSVQVDVRIIAATHQNLRQLIAERRFREDLYYRLNVLDVHIPPLRDRRGDLPTLVEHFLRRSMRGRGEPPSISPEAWAALSEYAFPGNVRELQHAIERAVVMSREHEIELEHLPEDIAGARAEAAAAASEGPAASVRPLAVALRAFEREYLLRALESVGGKKAKAAELLGISRKNLWEKLRAHGVHDGDDT